jgi:addiction module HigA family antidote
MMSSKTQRLAPIHPGEILREEFMRPMEISINRLARDLVVPPNRISEIVNGKRGITADTALRLARYFKTSPELWMGMQTEYDLRVAARSVGNTVKKQVRPFAA